MSEPSSEHVRLPTGPDEAELGALRAELSRSRGPSFWTRLEELAASAPFQAFLRRHFPSQAFRFGGELERRDFLRVMGSSLAVAGLGACTRQPEERIVPYSRSPELLVPGRPRYFATAMPLDGDALGLLVESHMNRPTKVEGNPDHPGSLGSTHAFAQAAVLSLYDPDRSESVLRNGEIATWEGLSTELAPRMDVLRSRAGEGMRVLTGRFTSPSLQAQLRGLLATLPRARWHCWAPLHRDEARRGAELAFGRDARPRLALDRARVVVSLDADVLASGPSGVRHARDFAAARAGRASATAMNRLYAVEGAPTLTGAMADHRLALRPSRVEAFARILARALDVDVAAPPATPPEGRFASALAEDLRAHTGESLVIAGEEQGAVVHALAHLLNDALGNAGRTVEYVESVEAAPVEDPGLARDSVAELAADLRAGRVTDLVLLGGNPVLDAPCDLDFASALRAASFRVHLADQEDETSRLCHWHVPRAHFLESWDDVRAQDGTVTIVQPLIAPLWAGRTAQELVSVLAGKPATAHDLVRGHWRAEQSELDDAAFERWWRTALHDGVVAGTRLPALDLRPLASPALGSPAEPADGLEIAFRPDAGVHDGRFANNAWLQETPRPLTRTVWDNAALVSPATARELGLADGDVVELAAGERRVEAPVLVVPGQPDGATTLHLGYGRTSAGRLGSAVGFDAYRLRRSDAPGFLGGATLRRTGRRHAVVTVQKHAGMEGRGLVRVGTFDRFRRDPRSLGATSAEREAEERSLYPPRERGHEGNAWGMVIDLNACIGCNACMVACQAENNVPVVGREEVARGREMHWIRIDRYYEERPDGEPEVLHQPVPCMHCEDAPCEVVCPVGATVHSADGLNEMVYNRCVGTRYCANNCPYKVRRFNFFPYADTETESLALQRNPDVTVRSRGVMEKCTYCVQRIHEKRLTAKKEERDLRDGEVVPACQQACPTQAIVFGDVHDPASRVSALREEPHHYALLAELGTRPRTTYLAKLRNPNPRLEG